MKTAISMQLLDDPDFDTMDYLKAQMAEALVEYARRDMARQEDVILHGKSEKQEPVGLLRAE